MRRRIRLWHGLVASILLHAALVLPFTVTVHRRQKPHTLVVELQGVIGHRQLEQKTGAEQPPQPVAPPPQAASERREEPPKPEEKPKPEKKKVVRPAVPLRRVERTAMSEPARPPSVSPPSPPVPSADSGAVQRAETIRAIDDGEALKGYLRELKRKLQNNLVYPDSAKLAGLQGTAVIGFSVMENGAIREDTLRIIKSSGFPDLDLNALSTARSSAPFPPPPKEIAIAIAVGFAVGD